MYGVVLWAAHKQLLFGRVRTLAYKMVKPIAAGRFTHVLRKGMISAPLPGAVTTSTSCSPEGSATRHQYKVTNL